VPADQVTRLLAALREGEPAAAEALVVLVYDELRRMARAQLRRERPGQTLQPTALVHEAYLRLLGDGPAVWESRGHFFTAAAEAMRRILVERARARRRLKRGSDPRRTTMRDDAAVVEPAPEELLALDDALAELEGKDQAMAAVVKLRYFAGLTVEETAASLDLSTRSVNRLWTGARAWLLAAMSR
jgi:RNA polymerase sigma factor (TIGR02999 family)